MTKEEQAKIEAAKKAGANKGNGQTPPTPPATKTETPKKTKRERFEELAPARTQAIIDKFRQLGNTANRSNYEYYAQDVKKIFTTLQAALDECKVKFEQAASKEKKNTFALDKIETPPAA